MRGFRFGAGIGENPVREAAGEAPRHIGAHGQSNGRAGRGFLDLRRSLGLRWFHDRLGGRTIGYGRLGAIFCKRFTREKNRFFRRVERSARSAPALVKATLLGAARFESTRLWAALIVAARFATALLSTLR